MVLIRPFTGEEHGVVVRDFVEVYMQTGFVMLIDRFLGKL